MKKIYAILLVLVCLFGVGLINNDVNAVTESILTFKVSDSDKTTAISDISPESYLSNANEYVYSIESDKAYVGVNGIKLGTSSSNGTLIITLKNPYHLKSIIVESVKYGNDTGNLSFTYGTYNHNTNAIGESYTYDLSTLEAQSSFTLSTTTKRGYIKSITLNLKDEQPTFEEKVTAIFYDYNNKEYYRSTVTKESTFEFPSSDPQSQQTQYYEYIFSGWYLKDSEGNLSVDAFDPSTLAVTDISLYPSFTRRLKDISNTFSLIDVKSNLKFGYTNRIENDMESFDLLTIDESLLVNKGQKTIALSETLQMDIDDTQAIQSKKYADSFRVYNGSTLSFSSSKVIKQLILHTIGSSLSVANNYSMISAYDYTIIDNINNSSSIDITVTSTTKIKSIDVIYDYTSACNFTDVSMQFRYDFDFSLYDGQIESGLILTPDSDVISRLKLQSEEAKVNEVLSSSRYKKIINDSLKESFVYQLTLVTKGSYDTKYCNDIFYAVSYVKVDGIYYFSNETKGYSVKSILEAYTSTLDKVSYDVALVINDFTKQLNGGQNEEIQ